MVSMKIAYLDCFSGISGDMFSAAMLDAGLPKAVLLKELKKLKIPGLQIVIKKTVRHGISGTHFLPKFRRSKQPHPKSLREMLGIVNKSKLSKPIKSKASKILTLLAKIEAKIHHKTLNNLKFHEIGAYDTIVDICSALIAVEKLGIEKLYCSALNLGSGLIRTEHGIFPIPGPASAELLKNIPIYFSEVKGELVTPTGALIVNSLCSDFGQMPKMVPESVGYGCGTYDFPTPNALRVFIGNLQEKPEQSSACLIQTNIDDMQSQLFEHVMQKLFDEGAKDVWFTPIVMKKSRPAIQLSVLCHSEDVEHLSKVIFTETTTLGLRVVPFQKLSLSREEKSIKTKFGKVKFKVAKLDGKIVNSKPEYEACRRIAKKFKIPLKNVYAELAGYA